MILQVSQVAVMNLQRNFVRLETLPEASLFLLCTILSLKTHEGGTACVLQTNSNKDLVLIAIFNNQEGIELQSHGKLE
jgi:hypothetical protein